MAGELLIRVLGYWLLAIGIQSAAVKNQQTSVQIDLCCLG